MPGSIHFARWPTVVVLGLLALLPLQAAQAAAEWQSLFDGQSLRGWTQRGGAAVYTVENGVLVGTSKANTPNSFLSTEQLYGDFILEFEVWVDAGLNSGVQVRSNSRSEYKNGIVHGLQVEIDTSARAFSGGLYDESRRGWLYPLTRNDAARSAFRNGEWNHYRVEAVGSRISIWINGQQTARLVDDLEPRGFIALQVHSVENATQIDRQIRWRNIRIQTQDLAPQLRADHPSVPEISFLNHALTPTEQRQGWRLLQGGPGGRDWRQAPGWDHQDGVLTTTPAGDGAAAAEAGPGRADLVTVQAFSDFELQLEFKLPAGAASAIQYGAGAGLPHEARRATPVFEFPLLDDKQHPQARLGANGNRTLGSLHDLIPAENLSIPGRNKQYKGVGQWNHVRIVVRGGRVEHWLNHEKVIDVDRHSQALKALWALRAEPARAAEAGAADTPIRLLNRGAGVQFRNIKIRE